MSGTVAPSPVALRQVVASSLCVRILSMFPIRKVGSAGRDYWRRPWCGRTGVTTQTQYFEQTLRRRFDRTAGYSNGLRGRP